MSSEYPDAAPVNNNTPNRHPEGRAVHRLSPQKTPHSQRRANKRPNQNQNNNARVGKIDEGIMQRNADIGHDGNVDGQDMVLPPNLDNFFDGQDIISFLDDLADVENSATNEKYNNNSSNAATTTFEGDVLGIPTPGIPAPSLPPVDAPPPATNTFFRNCR